MVPGVTSSTMKRRTRSNPSQVTWPPGPATAAPLVVRWWVLSQAVPLPVCHLLASVTSYPAHLCHLTPCTDLVMAQADWPLSPEKESITGWTSALRNMFNRWYVSITFIHRMSQNYIPIQPHMIWIGLWYTLSYSTLNIYILSSWFYKFLHFIYWFNSIFTELFHQFWWQWWWQRCWLSFCGRKRTTPMHVCPPSPNPSISIRSP